MSPWWHFLQSRGWNSCKVTQEVIELLFLGISLCCTVSFHQISSFAVKVSFNIIVCTFKLLTMPTKPWNDDANKIPDQNCPSWLQRVTRQFTSHLEIKFKFGKFKNKIPDQNCPSWLQRATSLLHIWKLNSSLVNLKTALSQM